MYAGGFAALLPDLADLRPSRLSACSTSASPPTPYHAGRWHSRSATAHNGEINTITGNRQWARARTYKFQTPLIPDLHDAAPFVNETGSDSSSMDNMLELLLAGGMDIVRAMRLLVPPAPAEQPGYGSGAAFVLRL